MDFKAEKVVRASSRKSGALKAFKTQIPERDLQAQVCGLLGLLGLVYSETDASRSFGRDGKPRRSKVATGWPDISFVLPEGRAGFFELKSAKGRLRAEQKITLAKLVSEGAAVAVIRSLDSAIVALSHWLPVKCEARNKLERITL